MTTEGFELGLDSFGEVATDGGRLLNDAETVRLLVDEARLAESVGLDVFSVGEHYREGHNDSATPVLLAAIATATERIRLGTSVTVLSTNDPVRLYHEFSTLDAVSNGRAQIVLGRASATESFPLFGYDLADYERLFEEKLDLFVRLQQDEPVTWSGTVRSPLVRQRLHPRMRPGGIPTWIGVGGSPNSVIRAARYGLPLMLAIIGGRPQRFAGHVDLYHRALEQFGHPVQPIGQHSLGLVADTDEEAVETWWQYWQPVVAALAEERGFYKPDRKRYQAEIDQGALFVGSPETVAQKIATVVRDLRLSRFDLKYDIMHLPREARARTIELLGSEVAPRVRELLAKEPPMSDLEFGLDTFGDVPEDDAGKPVSHAVAIRQVVEEAVLADGLGVDVIALGEHHRPEYSISTPETVLAGIATRTSRIRLASGVTVLSSDDPVRVFQRFATVDALSNGRAEVILGRGSFTESFPLFGYDLRDYDVLFEEKIELFAKLLEEKPVTWSGSVRAPLENADVFPKTESGHLNTWVGVGGSPQSVVRTAHYGLPLMLAIIGGDPERFAPYIDLYRRAAEQFGTTAYPVGMHSPGFIADTDEQAKELFWPYYRVMRDRIGKLRGWPPIRREEFDSEVAHGSLYIGSPETVARRMAHAIRSVGVGRFDLIYTAGAQPVSARMRAVELYGSKVIPMVRDILAG